VPLEPPKWVKYRLSLNENFFISRELLEGVIKRALESVDPRLYHDAYGEELAESLAEFYRLDKREIVVGPGSDYLIELLASYARGKCAAIIEPTFEEYERSVKLFGGHIVKVLLERDFSLNPDKLRRADAEILFIASPNNPTGNQFDEEVIEEVVSEFRGIVVVDEAYAEYARYSLIDKVGTYENLVVLRTFSKAWGLAGLRVGYAVSCSNLISELRKRMRPFATSSISLKAAVIMLEYWDHVKRAIKALIEVREWLREEMTKLGVKPYPSDANFILARFPLPVRIVAGKLLERGFSVKDVSHLPLCDNSLRITVPPRIIAVKLVNALKSILGEARC